MASSKSKKKNRGRNGKRVGKHKSNLFRPESPKRITLASTPPGYTKMSEVLLEFVEPYFELAETEEEMEMILFAGIVAWNAALLSPKDRREILDRRMPGMSPPPEEARLLINDLIHRKERYFADIKRAIFNYQLTMTEEGAHVSVVSSFM